MCYPVQRINNLITVEIVEEFHNNDMVACTPQGFSYLN